VVAERQVLDFALGVGELVEAAAEVKQDQVALVAERGVERGLARLAPHHGIEHPRRVRSHALARRRIERAPCRAPYAEHLMKHGEALERQRRRRIAGGELRVLAIAVVSHGRES
jgi:hypothetical protein